jgi:hypothetical protein
MPFRIEATVICRFESAEIAGWMLKTLEPDNGEHLSSSIEGEDLISIAAGDSILHIRSTLDDFLACLGTAETVAEKGREHGGTGNR